MENASARLVVCEYTACDFNFRGITILLHSQNNLRIALLRRCCILNKLAAGNLGRAGRQNNAVITPALSIVQFKLTAADVQRGAFLALDDVQAAGICTARNRERTPVVDHGRDGIARGGGYVFEGQVGSGVHFRADCNVVVACAADDAAVLHGGRRALGNRQRCLARARIRQRLCAEVERDVLVDRHVLDRVCRQRDGIAVLGRRDGFGKGCIADIADLGDITLRCKRRQRERSQQHAEREHDRQKLVCLHCLISF